MISAIYKIQGMSCGGCERSVELAVMKVPGVTEAKADAKLGTLRLSYASGEVTPEVVASAVNASGYKFVG